VAVRPVGFRSTLAQRPAYLVDELTGVGVEHGRDLDHLDEVDSPLAARSADMSGIAEGASQRQ
jgi:hypothetical protein